jgi:hypothetical protein
MNIKTFILNISFLVATSILLIGCSKSSVNKEDSYYIKYQVESSMPAGFYGTKVTNTIKNEKNESVISVSDVGGVWEATIGPVKKGFNASLNSVKVNWTGEAEYRLKISLRIQVSKNNEPFSLKKSDEPTTTRASADIQYIIE